MTAPAFRFDPEAHEYRDAASGRVYAHITGLLAAGGHIDDRWYTEESSERGKHVHTLTAEYDLGALVDPRSCTSAYKGYLLGHVAAMACVPHAFLEVEVPRVHPRLRFAGRPDRVGRLYGLGGVLEVKSGAVEESHEIQTALQAILSADELGLPPDAMTRWALYLREDGRFTLREHRNGRDFARACELIRKYA